MDNNQEEHPYEEIDDNEMDEMKLEMDYEDVDIASDENPPPVVPRNDLDEDGYLNLEGQHDDEHAYQRPVYSNDDAAQSDDQPHHYLNHVPGNHESKYSMPQSPDPTANPYFTPYDHVSEWQKDLQSRMNRPQ